VAYATVSLRDEHRADLLTLWAGNLSDSRIGAVLDRRYEWLYRENPRGAVDTKVAIHEEAGRVVGCGSVCPRVMHVAGAELRVGVPSDFAVARAHRIGGAALGIQRALVADDQANYSFFVSFPNKSSDPIFRRVGYRPIGSCHAWIKPLSLAYKIEPRVGSARLARWLAAPLDFGLAVRDAWRGRRRPKTRTAIVAHADARFDALWERAKHAYVVTGERTAVYLNWRYSAFTTVAHQFFCLMDARGDLLGYIVFSIDGGKVFVADLFAVDMEETAELLVLRFARVMRRQRQQSVYLAYVGNPQFGQRLERIGFFPRGDQQRKLLAFTKSTTSEQERLLLSRDSWYMFEGEMDI
jgi:hypothetical protein